MAESVFRARVAEAGLDGLVEVDSAGTGGWHEGDGADPRTVAVLEANGYESDHTARQFQASWFARLDLVIALDAGHLQGPAPPRAHPAGRREGPPAAFLRPCRRAPTWTYPIRTTDVWTASRSVLRWWRRRAAGCSPRCRSKWRDERHDVRGFRYGERRRHTRGAGRAARTRQVRADAPGPGLRRALPSAGRAHGPVHLRPRREPDLDTPGARHRRAGGPRPGRRRDARLPLRHGRHLGGALLPAARRRHRGPARRRLPGAAAGARAADRVRHRGAHRPDRRRRPARRTRRREAAVDRDPVEPGARRVRRTAARRGGTRAGHPRRRRQHPGHPARAAPAGAGRRLLRGQRHQDAHRARRHPPRIRHRRATPL